MAFSDSVRLAVGTLTVLPSGAVRVDRQVARNAMVIAPLAVSPLAVLAAGAGWAGHRVGWPGLLCGLLVVGVLALGTRALHLDGLADTIDGLACGGERQKALAVMRRGDVGPMGVTALILILSGQAVAVGELLTSWAGPVRLAVLICCSRAVLVLVCVRGVPAARTDGLGAAVAGSVPRRAAAVTWMVVAGVLMVLSWWAGGAWWQGLVSALAVLLGAAILLRSCVRRFGGVTGDVMGAAVEISFTILVLGALLWR